MHGLPGNVQFSHNCESSVHCAGCICMARCAQHWGVTDLRHMCCAGHPGWSIWGMDSEAFLQDWKERPERVHIVAPMPATTHALSSNMLYQPQPQGEPALASAHCWSSIPGVVRTLSAWL